MIALFSPASFCVCLLYCVASFANVSAISFPSMFACALTFSILRLCRTCGCCGFVTVFVSCFEVLHLLKSLCIVVCESVWFLDDARLFCPDRAKVICLIVDLSMMFGIGFF